MAIHLNLTPKYPPVWSMKESGRSQMSGLEYRVFSPETNISNLPDLVLFGQTML